MIGTKWRHLKRGTEYTVIAISALYLEGTDEQHPVDHGQAWLVAQHEWGSFVTTSQDATTEKDVFLCLPVTLQVSGDYSDAEVIDFLVYTAGDGRIWARPEAEFTPDRFERIDA